MHFTMLTFPDGEWAWSISESTIPRDLIGIYGEGSRARSCPFCGAKPLDEEGACAIEAGHDRLRRWLGR